MTIMDRLVERPRILTLIITAVLVLALGAVFLAVQNRDDPVEVARNLIEAINAGDEGTISELMPPYAADQECRDAVDALATFEPAPSDPAISEDEFWQDLDGSLGGEPVTMHVGFGRTTGLGVSGWHVGDLAYTDTDGRVVHVCGDGMPRRP